MRGRVGLAWDLWASSGTIRFGKGKELAGAIQIRALYRDGFLGNIAHGFANTKVLLCRVNQSFERGHKGRVVINSEGDKPGICLRGFFTAPNVGENTSNQVVLS